MSKQEKLASMAGNPESEDSFLEVILKIFIWAGAILSFYIPWIIGNNAFFPFVGPKSLWFMLAAEIVFFGWLALAIINPKYRPEKNYILYSVLIYLAIFGLATIFGVDPSRSFWSKFERMTGFLMQMHCAMYFIGMSSYFRQKKQWTILLSISIFLALIMGLTFLGFRHSESLLNDLSKQNTQLQQAELVSKLEWPWQGLYSRYFNGQNGLSLGNKSFMGTYLMFHVFFALYLLLVAIFDKARLGLEYISHSQIWKNIVIGLCGLTVVILPFVMKLANTRAMFFSFLGGAALFLILSLFKYNKKIGLTVLAIFSIAAIIFLFSIIYPDSPFNKIYNINETFTKSGGGARLVIWKDVIPQIMARPVFGWGPENFELAFYPVFDPKLFLPKYGREVWFDRAHNVFVDYLVSTGFAGLIFYCGIFAAGVWLLYKEFKKPLGNFWAFATMIPLLAAYFVQNATVFDMVSSLLVFYLALALISRTKDPDEDKIFARNVSLPKWLAAVVVAVFLLFGYVFIVKGFDADAGVISMIYSYSAYDASAQACQLSQALKQNTKITVQQREQINAYLRQNKDVNERLAEIYGTCQEHQYRTKFEQTDFEERKKYFLDVVSSGKYGLYQNRDFIADIYINNISSFDITAVQNALKEKDPVLMSNVISGLQKECRFWCDELIKSTKESPTDYRAFLKLGYTAGFCGRVLNDKSYLQEAEVTLLAAQKISPRNPHTFWYMSQVKVFMGDAPGAEQWLLDALALREDLLQSYTYLMEYYSMARDASKAQALAKKAVAIFGQKAIEEPESKVYWASSSEQVIYMLNQILSQTSTQAVKK